MYSGGTFQSHSPLVPNSFVLHGLELERLLLALRFLFATVVASAYVLAYTARVQWPSIETINRAAVHYLDSRQYAFALPRLLRLEKLQPHDANLQLSLARAYVGLDQDVKAWNAITRAKKAGLQVQSDVDLTQELARHYLQKDKYDLAIGVLKPLAQKGNTRAQTVLGDYVTYWGNYAFMRGNYVEAKKYWLEARDMRR